MENELKELFARIKACPVCGKPSGCWELSPSGSGKLVCADCAEEIRLDLEAMAEAMEDSPCCICGKSSIDYYDDREDCPSCGSPRCELKMQGGLDYHDEVGNRD